MLLLACADDCTEIFDLSDELSAAQVIDAMSAAGVGELDELECFDLCTSVYEDARDTVLYSVQTCAHAVDPELFEAAQNSETELVGNLICSGTGAKPDC